MVMVIIGLLAGIALPQMQKMAESIEVSNQRADLRTSIEGLGYKAYVTAKPVLLESAAVAGGTRGSEVPQAVRVPAGWRVQVSPPIRYAANGVCSGGRIALTSPHGVRESFLLKPPRCLLEPVSDPE